MKTLQYKSKIDGKWWDVVGDITQDSIRLGLEGFELRWFGYAIGEEG